MNLKTELVTLAVRVLAEKTNLVRKPDPFENMISELFTGQTYEQRVAQDMIGKTDEVVSIVKSVTTRCRSKKIQNG
jgi:hypothetical protein